MHRASPPQHDDAATRTMLPNWHEQARPPAGSSPPEVEGRDAPSANTTASPPCSFTVPGLTARTEGAARTRAMNADDRSSSAYASEDSPSGSRVSVPAPSVVAGGARGEPPSAKILADVEIVTGSSSARDPPADASPLVGGASHRTNAELTHAPSPTSTATRPPEPKAQIPGAPDVAPPKSTKLTKLAPETITTAPPLASAASGRAVDASGRTVTITSPPTPPATSSESAIPPDMSPLRPDGTHATWTTVNPGESREKPFPHDAASRSRRASSAASSSR
mmetsp:Transcript_12119/g.48636  ORF Transcript_12119/g.48636 Transcript_12119/m.48636 type:complete len:279 (+) Transcript_12119:3169-4005(+)